VEGSANGTDWFPAPIADPATPETVSVATFVITAATTTLKFLRPGHPWRFLRVTMSGQHERDQHRGPLDLLIDPDPDPLNPM
jgi:hypothetical protein